MKKILSLVLSAVLLLSAFSVAASTEDVKSCTEGFICGDANGDGNVNAKDVSAFLKYFAEMENSVIPEHMDTNCDGKTNARDCAYMLKFLAEWDGIYRLGHIDTCEVTEAPLTDKKGVETIKCTKCGDFIERETDYAIISVCGTDLSEYTAYYQSTIVGADLSTLKDYVETGTAEYIGLEVLMESASTGTAYKKPISEHEILFGASFTRDDIPVNENGAPHYGVTEKGTIYFICNVPGMFRSMWEMFLRDKIGASIDRKITNKNGCEIEPFDEVIEILSYDRLAEDGYKVVFEDDFDGDSLDMEKWQKRGQETAGYNSLSQVSLEDGNLVMTIEYKEDGEYGEGWYGACIAPIDWYKYGYFEIKAKPSKPGEGLTFWSAFWLQSPNPYKWDKSLGGAGEGGAELDVVEWLGKNHYEVNIWCSGKDGYDAPNLDNAHAAFEIEDAYDTFHTYALEWDENYYTFYVDNYPVFKSDYALGTSPSAQQVILETVLGNADAGASHDYKGEFIVDYFRIMQK